MKVALVHDWLTGMRGGEKVLEAICELFPQADIYTLVYDKEKISDIIKRRKIKTSFIQRLPLARKIYRYYLPLFPFAIERFRLSGYDLVISSSHCVAKGVKAGQASRHICYCLTPMRYVWVLPQDSFGKRSWFLQRIISLLIGYLRNWDIASTSRVDWFVATCMNVKERIRNFYGREAEVIYPPVDTSAFSLNGQDGDYYLIVSALVPYKRIDIAIEAFNKLGLPLIIIGSGPCGRDLEKKVKSDNIKFLGWQPLSALRDYYGQCKALVFPGEEDFGIASLEAQACGRPVIAYRVGGALETVIEGETGIFFSEQTVESLIEAVRRFEGMNYDKAVLRNHALRFDRERFKEKFLAFVKEKIRDG